MNNLFLITFGFVTYKRLLQWYHHLINYPAYFGVSFALHWQRYVIRKLKPKTTKKKETNFKRIFASLLRVQHVPHKCLITSSLLLFSLYGDNSRWCRDVSKAFVFCSLYLAARLKLFPWPRRDNCVVFWQLLRRVARTKIGLWLEHCECLILLTCKSCRWSMDVSIPKNDKMVINLKFWFNEIILKVLVFILCSTFKR